MNRRRFVQATGVGVAGLAGGVPLAQGDFQANWENPDEVLQVLYLGGVEDGATHYSEDLLKVLAPYMLERGVELHYTERQDDLNAETLSHYDAVMLYGNRLDPTEEQIDALVNFVEDGGGFVPVHSASASFTSSDRFIDLVGGQFQTHGEEVMTTDRIQPDHPIYEGVDEIEVWEETYRHTNVADDIEVLAYGAGGDFGEDEDEPWNWVREQGDGRVFYTAWGHSEVWEEDGFKQLLHNAIRWSSGNEDTIGDHQMAPEKSYTNVSEYGHDEIPNPGRETPDEVSSDDDGTWDLVQDSFSVSDSLAHTITPAEFEMEYFVSEETLPEDVEGQILDMTFDAAGRCWLSITQDYPNDAGSGNDQIVICEDTDGDGVADEFTVFEDGLSIPHSIIPHQDGVIAAEVGTDESGRVVYFGDEDGDDVADVEDVIFSGYGTGDTHAGLNQLYWGHDNWVYGVVGYAGLNPDIDGAPNLSQDLFRFKPDGSELEFVGSGASNMAGVKTNEEGLVFCSSATAGNNVTTYAAIPAAYYDYINGYEGWTTVDIRSPTNLSRTENENRALPINDRYRAWDWQGAFTAASDQEIYSAREFPEQYWNSTTFVGEGTAQLMSTFYLEQDGASYEANYHHNLVASNDEWVSPTYANTGPDGMVWMIDFYNFIFQHNPTPDGYDNGPGNAYVSNVRQEGEVYSRLYRVTTGEDADPHPMDLSDASPSELVDALSEDNMFWRKTAQRKLIEQDATDVVDDLVDLATSEDVDEIGLDGSSIHALWTLEGLDAIEDNAADLRAALSHASAGVRLNAVRVLPGDAATRDAILENDLLNDEDDRVAMWAMLKLAETPESDEAGAAIFDAIDDEDRLEDELLVDAASVGAATHAVGFLDAYEAEYGDPDEQIEGANILDNGSVEQIDMAAPDGWQTNVFGGDGEFTYTDEESSSGERSIRIDAEEGTDAAWQRMDVPVEPDTDYQLRAMIKTENVETADSAPSWAPEGAPFGACFNVEELANGEDLGAEAITEDVTGTTDGWTEVTLEFNSMGYEQLQFNALFGAYGSEATGTAWFDDIRLVTAEEECELVHEDPANRDDVPDEVDHIIYCEEDDEGFGGENVFPNGDLEEGNLESRPAGWENVDYTDDGSHVEFVHTDEEAFEGDYSLQISSDDGIDAGWNTTVEVDPDTDYTLVANVKTENVQASEGFTGEAYGAVLSIEELANGADGPGDTDYMTETVTGTTDWTEVSVEFNSGDLEELQINALFGAYTSDATGTAYYDNIQLIDPEGEEQPNVLENASFEEVEDGSPVGWSPSTWGGDGEWSVDDSMSRTGDYSVRIDSESGGDLSWSQDVSVEPNTEYELSGYVQTENFDPGSGFGACMNAHQIGQDSIPGVVEEEETDDWVHISGTFNSGGNTELTINTLYGGWGQSTGTVWWDDVALRPLEDVGEGIDAIYGRVERHLEQDGGDEPSDDALDPSETIELDAEVSGWTGQSPDSIAEETNPTLRLAEGEEYTVEWTNLDGVGHNFEITTSATHQQLADDSETLESTDYLSEEGASTTLTFTASADMAGYDCAPHAEMSGEIEIVEE